MGDSFDTFAGTQTLVLLHAYTALARTRSAYMCHQDLISMAGTEEIISPKIVSCGSCAKL